MPRGRYQAPAAAAPPQEVPQVVNEGPLWDDRLVERLEELIHAQRQEEVNPQPVLRTTRLDFTHGTPVRRELVNYRSQIESQLQNGVLDDALLRQWIAVADNFPVDRVLRQYGMAMQRCSGCYEWTYAPNLKVAYAGLQYVCKGCDPQYVRCDTCNCLILQADNILHVHTPVLAVRLEENQTRRHDFNVMETPFVRFRTAADERPGRFGHDIHLGVELEVERRTDAPVPPDLILKTQLSLPQFVIVKHDGSLSAAPGQRNGTNGFEIVSVPATRRYHIREAGWQQFFAALGPFCQERPPSAGLHFHVNWRALTHLTVAKLVQFVNEPNNLPFLRTVADRDFTAPSPVTGRVYAPTFDPAERVRELITRRKHRTNCPMTPLNRLVRGHYLTPDQKVQYDGYGHAVIQSLMRHAPARLCHCPAGQYDYPDHYAALNVRTGHASIEFRIFQGSMNPAHFFASLDACVALIEFCAGSGFSQLSSEDFMDWFKTARPHYPHLARWLVITGLLESRRNKKGKIG